MTTKSKPPKAIRYRLAYNEINEIVGKLMIEGWRKSLEKAKQDAAKGDLDAAKDVEALTLWIHGVMSGSLACASRIAPHLLLDWRQYPHKARNLFSVCTLRDGTGVLSGSLSSYE